MSSTSRCISPSKARQVLKLQQWRGALAPSPGRRFAGCGDRGRRVRVRSAAHLVIRSQWHGRCMGIVDFIPFHSNDIEDSQ
jgi:hypothetical protein